MRRAMLGTRQDFRQYLHATENKVQVNTFRAVVNHMLKSAYVHTVYRCIRTV